MTNFAPVFLATLALTACHGVSAPPPVVVVAATPTVAPSPPEEPARVIPPVCTEAAAAALFDVADDTSWKTACTELGEARFFSAWAVSAQGEHSAVTLRLARVQDGAITWESSDELIADLSGEWWSAEPVRAVEGTPGGIVVSVAGEMGEDYYIRESFTVVLRASGAGYERVWSGTGDGHERSMDACHRQTTATFRFLDANTLEVARTRRATWVHQRLTATLARQLRRECTPMPRRVERVTLGR